MAAIATQLRPAAILNVGCGDERYGTHFLDINPTRRTVWQFDAEHGLPYQDGSFAEVYSRCLFEHLRNPGAFLHECYRVLAAGGRCVVITDNAAYLWHYTDARWARILNHLARWLRLVKHGVVGLHAGAYGATDQDGHFAIYHASHLLRHFLEAGFTVEALEHGFFQNGVEAPGANTPFGRWLAPRIRIVGVKPC